MTTVCYFQRVLMTEIFFFSTNCGSDWRNDFKKFSTPNVHLLPPVTSASACVCVHVRLAVVVERISARISCCRWNSARTHTQHTTALLFFHGNWSEKVRQKRMPCCAHILPWDQWLRKLTFSTSVPHQRTLYRLRAKIVA